MTTSGPPPPVSSGALAGVLTAFAAGAGVCVAVGVYGAVHDGTGVAIEVAPFSSFLTFKVWLTTVVGALAILQVVSAAMVYGGLPGNGRLAGVVHRWSGRIAVLISVPVAAHCLYAFGFQYGSARGLVHSVLGTFLYGVFTTKMLVLTRDDSPGWVLPVVGGGLFAAIAGLWLTSSLWFFTSVGVTL